MGTLAAGIKDIFSTAKTTGTNVMLSGNDGTPDGHITMANLASVLGAFKVQNQVTSGSANDCKDIGHYIIRTGVTDLPSPFLNTFATFLFTFSDGGAGNVQGTNSYIQIATNYNVAGIYIRKGYGDSWSVWSRADGFGYEDLSSLASAMGINIDYRGESTSDNPFGGYGALVLKIKYGNYIAEIALRMVSTYSEGVIPELAFRHKYGAYYSAWKNI